VFTLRFLGKLTHLMMLDAHIPRLFVPYGSDVTTDGYGLPIVPDMYHQEIKQRRWDNWQDEKCIVLLGEPGSGKSTEFEHQAELLKSKGKHSFLVRIRDYRPGYSLGGLVAEQSSWMEWLNDRETDAYLFLDSVDEGRLQFDAVLRDIIDDIRNNLPYDRLKLRLSCRTRDWRDYTDRSDLTRLFPEKVSRTTQQPEPVTVLELLGLDAEAIFKQATSVLHHPEDFIRKAEQFHIIQLCSHPLLLEFLLAQFEDTSDLAPTRTEAYEKAIDRMSMEENPIHGEAIKGTLSPVERREIAAMIAVLSILNGNDSLYIAERDHPKQHGLDCYLADQRKKPLVETLNSKLFTGAGAGAFRFYHRSLAEFLAARFIDTRLKEGLSFLQIKPLLFTGSDKVPTPIRNTVSWLASFNSKARHACLKTDPTVVLEGDLSMFEVPEREQVIKALAKRYQDRTWQSHMTQFGVLGQGCSKSLLEDLLAKRNSLAVRIMALEIIEDAEVGYVSATLLGIALDGTENQAIRRRAIELIIATGSKEQKEALKPLLNLPTDQDRNYELAGTVLKGLFPELVTLDEAFGALRVSRDTNFIGNYFLFWHASFYERIRDEELPQALAHIYALIQSRSEEHWWEHDKRLLPELFSKLLVRLLNSRCDIVPSAVAPWFALFGETRVLRHAFEEGSSRQIETWLVDRPSMKRELLKLSLIRKPPTAKNNFSPWRDTPFPFVAWVGDDFDWLCDECSASTDTWQRHAFFQLALAVWTKNSFLPIDRFEKLENLALTFKECGNEWKRFLITPIDREERTFTRELASRKKEEKKRREENRAAARKNVPKIRTGALNWLTFFSSSMAQKSHEYFEHPNFSILDSEFGSAVSAAAQQGYSQAWRNISRASLEEIVQRINTNQVPWIAVVYSHAIEAEWASKRVDWSEVGDRQLKTAALIAIGYYESLPEWFESLYLSREAKVKEIMNDLMETEVNSESSHTRLCSKIRYSKILKSELVDYLCRFFLSHPVPKNQYVLETMLNGVIQQPRARAVTSVGEHARKHWCTYLASRSKPIMYPMVLLAAWWYLDWHTAWRFLVEEVLVGRSWKRRVAHFMGAVSRVCTTHELPHEWPPGISTDASAALVPYLYLVVPPAKDPDTRGVHIVDASRHLVRLRDIIVNRVAGGKASIVRDAFLGWASNLIFSYHKDWFLNVLDDIERKITDESWQPATPDHIRRVITGNARIVRNTADLNTLLVDICENELRERLADDASIVPLLWERAKRAGRRPRNEKVLQVVLANQLKFLLHSKPTVFAREPELFDEKKPEFRISSLLPDNKSVHIPIEVKQAFSKQVWSAPSKQLVEKYMRQPSVNFGAYFVGWYGNRGVPRHPETKKKFTDPVEFQDVLQEYVDAGLSKTEKRGKRVTVFVYDVRVD
jgi:hypothetical protein